MGRWLLAVAVALAGCVQSDLVPCDSVSCPVGNVCVSSARCATVDEVAACTGKAEASDCIVGETTGICTSGMCTTAVCGNGVLDPGEACDDGNRVSGDGCSYDCLSNETCGNGYVDYVKGEMCDDGNRIDGDACENDCTLPKCGNGIVDEGEDCDDGNTVDGDGCSSDCKSNEMCGNGIRDPGEQCDDGNLIDHDGCQHTCVRERCGDGITDPADATNGGVAEQCDDGNSSNTDACLNTCQKATCGDGFVETGVEQCDDGNKIDNDSCSNTCTFATCGDGVVEASVEDCDLGSANSNTGCCLTNCTQPICGDGKVECDETCDPSDPTLGSADLCLDGCTLFCAGSDKGGVSFIIDAAGTLSDTPPPLIADTTADSSSGVGFLDATFGGLTTTVTGETPCGVQTVFTSYTPEVIDKSNGQPIVLQYFMINDTSELNGGLAMGSSAASFSVDQFSWSGQSNYCSTNGGSGTWVPEVTLTVTDACHRPLNYSVKLANNTYQLDATDWPVCPATP